MSHCSEMFAARKSLPTFSPLLSPASGQTCCCEVLLDFPPGNGYFEYLLGLEHYSSLLANSHGPSRKILNSPHPLLFVSGFCFISLFSLSKSQVKEQIIWITSINSNTQVYTHFYKASLIIPMDTGLENYNF